jgi:molecular chaperone DnaK (HSP70)
MNPRCRRCYATCATVDDYCAWCGVALVDLEVSPARSVLRDDTDRVELTVRNKGVLDGSLALRSADTRDFPAWLLGGVETDRAVALGPGEAQTLELKVEPNRLPSGRLRQDHERATGHHVVPLVTDALRWDPRRRVAARRKLTVELAAQSKPRVAPEVIAYRFLPVERVTGGEIEAHAIEVVNEGGHPIELVAVEVEDAPVGTLEGLHRLPARAVVVVPPLSRAHTLGPDQGYTCKLAIKYDEGLASDAEAGDAVRAVLGGEVGLFAAEIRFRFQGAEPVVAARVEGIIGRGPRVELADQVDNIVRAASGPARGQVRVRNPGAVAVKVLGVDVLTPDGEPAPEEDWLKLDTVERGLWLPAGGERDLELWVDPGARSREELDEPWGERIIRVRHDGLPDEQGERHLETKISAELGRVKTLETAVIGVDFGTSNSSVCLLHGESGRAEPLVLDPKAGEEQLASLLFYRGHGQSELSPFLFGRAAENAASINYANLVRSIKSVVARDPETVFNFVETGPSGTRQLATYQSQDLLEIFIAELKRRAEAGVRRLPAQLLGDLGLLDTGVRFERAVFTHPVGVGDPVIGSLHRAAIRAGLGDPGFDRFKADDTLDEALAAVVAFVYIVASGTDLQVTDDERVLCIDVGGGTTDMAAVQVQGLAAFHAGKGQRVDLTLLASGGDARFGGDDLDRLLGERILDGLEQGPQGALFDVAGVRRAMGFPSFESFRRSTLERYEGSTIDPRELSERARQLYGKATDVLRAAERAKVALTSDPAVTVVPPVDDWPLKNPRAQRPAGLRIELELTRGEAQRLYADVFQDCAGLVVPVLDDAGWSFDEITCVLFTGQGSRVPELREAILGKLQSGRTRPLPTVVHPDGLAGFDPKRCVAMGAAVWGDSKMGGGGWLKIVHRGEDALSSSLQTRRGPRFVDVEGLTAGAPLPARGLCVFAEPARALTLYRTRKLAFSFELPEPRTEVELVAHSDHRVVAIVDGVEIEGVPS